MAVVADNNETAQAAVASSDPNDSARKRPPSAAPKRLDPKLLMAARRGDSEQLKELLRLMNDDDQDRRVLEAAAASEVVIVEVVPRHRSPAPAPAAAPPPPSSSGPAASELPLPLAVDHGVTSDGDTLLHVVAACGNDSEEFLRCAKMIVYDYKLKGGVAAMRLALEARNCNGDTPLHCAAAAGNANMISCLLDLIAGTDETAAAVKALLRRQNKCGETVLHQAVQAPENNKACIDQLMDMDPELACIPRDGEDGASPLYLAITLGDMKIARHLYAKSKGNLSYYGPDGRNILHAAVYRAQALPTVLEWLKDMKTVDDIHRGEGTVEADDLLSRLTSQRDKQQNGSTPLHLAASLELWEEAGGLIAPEIRQVWSAPEVDAATLLLDANLSMAYQADDEGGYPIHMAAHAGSLRVVRTLLERCPDCATMRDAKGRTFLHVAVEKEQHHVHVFVRSLMGLRMSARMRIRILNAQDSNGDTALHGAVRAGNLEVFRYLLRDRQVRLDVTNKDGMTPLDLARSMIPPGFNFRFNPRNMVHISLVYAGAPHGGGRPDLFLAKHIPKRDIAKESKKHTEATQVTSIVTALIATVTFASAFTLPGGYRSADNGDSIAAAGTPVLAGSYAFDAFILADTLAFICSIAATCFLVYAGLPAMEISIRNWYFNVSAALLQSAARSLVLTFALALYLVLAPVHHTSAVVLFLIILTTSIYGNMQAWQVIRMAVTVGARMRQLELCSSAATIIFCVMVHFWSYIIIFGLPAVRKLARR